MSIEAITNVPVIEYYLLLFLSNNNFDTRSVSLDILKLGTL